MNGSGKARSGTAVVLGAGLAGLSAAMEFAKSGCFSRIVVLEKTSEVGGNVRSRRISVWDPIAQRRENRWVDFGALEVWEWYTSFLETVDQVGLKGLFVPISRPPTLLERSAADAGKDCAFEKFRVSSVVNFWHLTGLAEMPDSAFDPYEQDDEPTGGEEKDSIRVDRKTSLAKLFPPDTKGGRDLATYYESYTYGATSEAPAYLWLPMVVRDGKEMTANGRTQFVPWKMQEVLSKRYGCEFVFDARVDRVDADAKTVTYLVGRKETRRTLKYDELVSAVPFGSVVFSHLSKSRRRDDERLPIRVDRVEVDSDRPEFRYTSYAAVCVRMDAVPDPDSWSACFAIPRGDPLQIRSWVNLHGAGGVSNRILFYVHAETSADLQRVTPDVAIELIRKLCFFDGRRPEEVDRIEYFSHTMPVFNAAFLRAVKQVQGRGNVWFAGHYLASFPSIELATYTGKRAALTALEARRSRQASNCPASVRTSDALRNDVEVGNRSLVRDFRRRIAVARGGWALGAVALVSGFVAGLAAFLVSQTSERTERKP